MKKRMLLTIPTIALAAGYVINDNEFRLAFDRDYSFPAFISGKEKSALEKEFSRSNEKGIEFIKSTDTEYLTIRNSQNNVIASTFISSKDHSKKFVILSHGYRNYGIREFGSFFPFYYEQGINMLVIDHQAHGNSEGKYITFGYQEHLDLIRWIEYLVQNYGDDIEVYLHGISMGAATVCMASGSEELPIQVKGIISDCSYISASKQLIRTMKSFHTPLSKTTYSLISKKLQAKCKANIDETNPIDAVKNCKVPITFIHGMNDTFVPTNDCVQLFDACSSTDKDLVLIEKAGHAQSYWYAKDQYQQAILEILNK